MSEDAKPRPAKVALDEVEWLDRESAPTRVRIKRLITRGRQGAELMQGVCIMEPGEETNLWSSREHDEGPVDHRYGPVEETYFVVRGRLKLIWDEGEIAFGAMDSIYLAPGWRYRLVNVGDEQAFFVYNMYPAQS